MPARHSTASRFIFAAAAKEVKEEALFSYLPELRA